MNFLAIDTSGKYLSVVACRGDLEEITFLPECAMKHSIVLMDEIDRIFARAHMNPHECDYFGAVVGPGSFTGIRIGISTVKGLCFACEKPALAVTSFDCLAYAEKSVPVLALADAGHGNFYACGYDENKRVVIGPSYCSFEEVRNMMERGFAPVAAEELFAGCAAVDPSRGLLAAAKEGYGGLCGAEELAALYLRKSSAEEKRS